jgi:glycosyltransferase involved in cell wall biosynthesis
MKTIMNYWAVGPDGNIEQKIENWKNKKYRGELLYGLTHFKETGLGVILPLFKEHRSYERKSWIPNLLDILREKRKYDIVYAAYYSGLEALIYLRGLRLYRKKIVIWQHRPIEKPKGKNFIRRFLYRVFLNGIDKFIFFGENARNESLESGILPKRKTAVLNWGPDIEFFDHLLEQASGKEFSDVRFISTGRDHRDFETLIKAFQGLSARLDLYVITKELFEKYENSGENITVHLIESNASFESSLLSSYTVGLALAKSSVVIICSEAVTNVKQSFGLTSLVEATALGKPSIVTRNRYIPQYFEDNRVGLFINPGNVEELKAAIIKISSDQQLRHQLGSNSRKFATERCNLKLLTKQLASLFESI